MSSHTPILAVSLRNLRAEVDARWPDRSKTSDGWVGDAAHAARVSDHNPDAEGVVHALDITTAGIEPLVLVVAATHHPATHYVIFRGHIWSVVHGWKPQPYSGPDPHRSHVHVSIVHTHRAEHSRSPWFGGH